MCYEHLRLEFLASSTKTFPGFATYLSFNHLNELLYILDRITHQYRGLGLKQSNDNGTNKYLDTVCTGPIEWAAFIN